MCIPTPRCTPKIFTPPRPAPGRPRPTCKVSALYLENCANASRQTETDNPLHRYRYGYMWNVDIDYRYL